MKIIINNKMFELVVGIIAIFALLYFSLTFYAHSNYHKKGQTKKKDIVEQR